jgi:putative ABC transport system permease protein
MNWHIRIREEFTRLGKPVDESVVEELAQHAAAAVEAARADGVSATEAEAASVALIESWCRETTGPRRIARAPSVEFAPASTSPFAGLWQDLRYSARLLRKHPGFTLTAVGVLTLGIGVNAGIFGIINGLMIRPLAGADAPGEVVGVFSKDRTVERDYRPFSYPDFSDVRAAGGPFAHLAGHTVALAGATEHSITRPVTVDIVTTGFFETLGVQPVYGRDFTREEEQPGTPARSAIVSYKVWERSGLDRGILEQTVRINGQDFAIVGVAPPHFTGTTAILGAEYYLPVGVHDAIVSDGDADGRVPISDRRSRPLILVGRLKPGVTRDQANAQLRVIAAAHERAYPDDNKNQDLVVGTLDRLDISTRPQNTQVWLPMGILQGLAATVLLTSCMNLANMMLAFGSARQKEITIRLAIGGTRARIVRQLLVQGLMLSLAGGALGLLTATWAAQWLVSSMATAFPIFLALDLTADTTVLFATIMFCSLATVGFGLWPALRLSRPDLRSSLNDRSGEIGGTIAGRITVRDALVTAQLALSLALLVSSGLFVRGAAAGASANPGFEVGQLAVAEIDPALGGYNAVQGREAHRGVLEKLRSTPGIESVAEASAMPFGDYSSAAAVQRGGPRLKHEDPDAAGKLLRVRRYTVTADYFKTVGLSMVQGREFTVAEEATVSGTTPVIIDVTLAERLFANEHPIGQLLQYGADSGVADSRPMVIVGLAPAVKHGLFNGKPEGHLYVPSGAADWTRMFVYARAAAPWTGDTIVKSVREQLRAAAPNLPVTFVKSFRAHHEGSPAVWVLRTAARMFLTLGLAGTFVAVIGLYGVRSYLVSRRTREFGVRMALGASPADVLRLVVRESLAITVVGLTTGLGLAVLLGWGLRAAIYQISPLDPVALGGATGILAIASIAASIIPARRAANVLPMTALRSD